MTTHQCQNIEIQLFYLLSRSDLPQYVSRGNQLVAPFSRMAAATSLCWILMSALWSSAELFTIVTVTVTDDSILSHAQLMVPSCASSRGAYYFVNYETYIKRLSNPDAVASSLSGLIRGVEYLYPKILMVFFSPSRLMLGACLEIGLLCAKYSLKVVWNCGTSSELVTMQ